MTGDIGVIDADGHLQITDRKKDIIVNSGGDNISPQRVEGILTLEPEIAQAMVYGDNHPHLVAVIVPDGEWVAGLGPDEDVSKALAPVLEKVNGSLSNLEKVRHFHAIAEPFSTDNGLLTPTMKIRRHKIKEVYGETLEGLYR